MGLAKSRFAAEERNARPRSMILGVQIVVPYPAGGVADARARIIGSGWRSDGGCRS